MSKENVMSGLSWLPLVSRIVWAKNSLDPRRSSFKITREFEFQFQNRVHVSELQVAHELALVSVATTILANWFKDSSLNYTILSRKFENHP